MTPCIMFGKRAVLDEFCKKLALAPRKTYLKETIFETIEELKGERK